MNKIYTYTFLILFLFSCEKNLKEENNAENINELIVTTKGDTLENGYWVYAQDENGISSSGVFEDGYRIHEWIYKSKVDSVNITWKVFNDKGVKFNFPDYIKPIKRITPPSLFEGNIDGNNKYTYLVLLQYDLNEIKSSVYDYLYQSNNAWESDTSENLLSKETRKFTFKNVEIFRSKIEVKRKEKTYESISYVFVTNGILYDLTYRDIQSEISPIDLEVFNDILYSMNCNEVDLFNYNNRQYLKEEEVSFAPH